MQKKLAGLILGLTLMTTTVTTISAHVVVTPSKVEVNAREKFSIQLHTEKESPITTVRLIIPATVQSVRPYVKQNWLIQTKTEGNGDAAVVKEMVWSGGMIPVGQQDEFVFTAKTPSEPSKLIWKTYVTYADGTVIAADSEEASENHDTHDASNSAIPAAQTEVVVSQPPSEPKVIWPVEKKLPSVFSTIAVVLAGFSLAMQMKKRT